MFVAESVYVPATSPAALMPVMDVVVEFGAEMVVIL
jgi:hypothetical protein